MMVQRLVERYPIGQQVEISFGDDGWWQGIVIRHQHPAVWVETEDGRQWFVTNARSIRKTAPAENEERD